MCDIYFWRQFFILSSLMFCCMSGGIMIAFPSVLNPGILKTNSTDIQATKEQVSWITTSNGIVGPIGFFILSPVFQIFGRKIVSITQDLLLTAGWITFALAQNVPALLAARIIQGVGLGTTFAHVMIIGEYSDPKRRGYFLALKTVSVGFGGIACHSLAAIWNWRQIALFALSISSIAFFMMLFWPESPSYLAMKGRFKESETSFIWLHGTSNMQELQLLHSAQRRKTRNLTAEQWYMFLFKKDFQKPFLIVFLATQIEELVGNHYSAAFIIQIMMELTGAKTQALYFSISADIARTFALILSCFVIVHFKRRTILISFGVPSVAVMLTIFCVIVLKLPFVSTLVPLLIALHSFIVNISIIPVCYALFGEIFPLEHKGWGSCLNGVIFTSSYALMLKITPIMLEKAGIGGMYGIFGIATAICLSILCFIVPETKDKTLLEIENDLNGEVYQSSNCDELMLDQQAR